MLQYRDYQLDIINRGAKILSELKVLLLFMEVRTGKTLTSLGVAKANNYKHVLFVTKKKAISSIKDDYKLLNPNYTLDVINYESVHKMIANTYDLIILDESHSLGAFPKRSKRTEQIKDLFKANKKAHQINLSGTPTPESYSQIFHQLWVGNNSPFKHTSFYGWAKEYVEVRKVKIAYGKEVNDYSYADIEKINEVIKPYMITHTQKEAGFRSTIAEVVLEVPMQQTTYNLVSLLENDRVYQGSEDVILADTPVKLIQKLHQIYSGSVITEDGKSIAFDHSKGAFIANYFKGKKIAIFYKYKGELEILKSTIPFLTTSLEEFNNNNKYNIALQIVSGREGISLKKADCLIFYNIDYSATSYFQAKDRLTTMDSLNNTVYWIFSKNGIEKQIYEKVINKKNFTYKHYERSNVSSLVN